MSKYKEGKVERYLVVEVEKRGGWAPKWSSPSQRGVPDRIVIMPDTTPMFVEVKATDGKLNIQQEKVHETLTMLGQDVWTVDCEADVDHLLKLWDAAYCMAHSAVDTERLN